MRGHGPQREPADERPPAANCPTRPAIPFLVVRDCTRGPSASRSSHGSVDATADSCRPWCRGLRPTWSINCGISFCGRSRSSGRRAVFRGVIHRRRPLLLVNILAYYLLTTWSSPQSLAPQGFQAGRRERFHVAVRAFSRGRESVFTWITWRVGWKPCGARVCGRWPVRALSRG